MVICICVRDNADDTLLLAPSPTALQNLIDICCHYFTSHRLVVNSKKCKCVAVCPKSLRDLCIPKLFVNGSVLTLKVLVATIDALEHFETG